MSNRDPFRVLRCQDPDVTINVWTGAHQTGFLCYRVFLCLRCDYFDNLFTRDKQCDRIINERMIERISRNETRQVGDGPHGRRIDVVLNEDPGGGRIDVFLNHEAENQESSGDEHERSDEEDAIHLHE